MPDRHQSPFSGLVAHQRKKVGKQKKIAQVTIWTCQTKAGTRPVTEQASSPLRGKRLGLCCQNEPQKTTLTGSEAEVRDGNCPSCTGPAGSEVKSDNPALSCFSTPRATLFLPFSRAQTGDFGQKLGFSRTGSAAGKQCHYRAVTTSIAPECPHRWHMLRGQNSEPQPGAQ